MERPALLNELYQIVKALDARGITIEERHPSLQPMGKNNPLLVVEIDATGSPSKLGIEPGEVAGGLMRICHGSQGASFPGFNLPTPLRTLSEQNDRDAVAQLARPRRARPPGASTAATFVADLFSRSVPSDFSDPEIKMFERSVNELVGWLREDFAGSGPELTNFSRLLELVSKANLHLPKFAHLLSEALARESAEMTPAERGLVAEWLFTDRKQLPVYLQCKEDDSHYCRVADRRMGDLLNARLLTISATPFDSKSRGDRPTNLLGTDAYTGIPGEVPATFPNPKVAILGNVRLFSNNSDEAGCFCRYGLGGSETFKVSGATAQRMAGALLKLASDHSVDKTCRAIPGNAAKKKDLLIAYLEEEPDSPDPYVELFGGEAPSFDLPDFAAVSKRVLQALAGKVAANPNQLVRLVAIAALDKANKQISLRRSFTVREVMDAAEHWQASAVNCPAVALPFFDKQARKVIAKPRAIPSPADVASLLNTRWASDPEGGFRHEFQRAFTVADAFDLFIGPPPLRIPKARLALRALLDRMRSVFAAVGRLKATSDFKALDDGARWQSLKAIALLGILLDQFDQHHEVFMKESVYQVGRVLALADSLHFHYCKWVRTPEDKRNKGKVDAPSELIGNSLFNFALDNPVAALARLAERIRPYKAWADTYTGDDAGLVRWFTRQLGECERQIDASALPARMEDIHKAQLLLGYLADHPKSQTKEARTHES